MSVENCIDCENHEIISDKDPDDWFCDDDVAVVCKKMPNEKMNKSSKHEADHSEFRAITVGCRPYNIKKESGVPSWCPRLQKK